ncbi:MAG: hypothetical protein M1160_03635 [Candidatus Marsarchaeota archaeon]|jgi:hypothetical protein|nr:hypothetical protein [Candidatus Marsarchaeota archaeon]MCL5111936.1 hypothetical protein [Candidatus Marsarchaeota archaeon]
MADQAAESAYAKLLKRIEQIEGAASSAGNPAVDISGSFAYEPDRKAPSYKDMLAVINEIERVKARVPKAAPAAQTVAPPPPQVKQEELAQLPTEQKEGANLYAGKELVELAKSLPVKIPKIGKHKLKREKAANLVLPNLSLIDQVAELERLLDAINAKALRGDELDTVASELYGLVEQVNAEKKQLKKGRLPSADEYQLMELRDQRIEAVAAALTSAEKAGE